MCKNSIFVCKIKVSFFTGSSVLRLPRNMAREICFVYAVRYLGAIRLISEKGVQCNGPFTLGATHGRQAPHHPSGQQLRADDHPVIDEVAIHRHPASCNNYVKYECEQLWASRGAQALDARLTNHVVAPSVNPA